ncbi:MAG: pirin family protein, partial [Mesorhizobium sp.]
MSFFPGNDPLPGDAFASDQIELMVIPNAKDIGGFQVRRALPTARRRLVGPFIFFDRMGPAILRAGQALDVRTEMVIQPGDVNLMTAGRGIVHSERTPQELRGAPMSVSGLQTWLALPDDKEEVDPIFENTAAMRLPEIDAEGVSGRVVIGAFSGLRSPVVTASDTLYADLSLAPGASVKIPADAEERAIYTLEGEVSISGDRFPAERLLVFRPGDEIVVSSEGGAHFMLFGGASLGSKRYIWWNFVSSSKERIEQAKEEWKTGRFDIVPGDEEEF